ncbi:MAG: thermonuclease family protein [Burkholderiales bacterium]
MRRLTSPRRLSAPTRPRRLAHGLLCAALLLTLSPAAMALDAIVIRVSDGDTLWLRTAPGKRPLRVRLQGIDAPELCQPGGTEARAALEALALGRRVQLRSGPPDRYGRPLVHLQRAGTDLASEMVRQGWAWSDNYRGRPGPYAATERAARAAQRGLFATPAAQAPWQFRQQHGPCVGLPPSHTHPVP